jgi:hypothetical protein
MSPDCRKLAACAAALMALGTMAATALAVDTTYGQDPVPDTQFWDGQLQLGYGVDRVPWNVITERVTRTDYGQDPVPPSIYPAEVIAGEAARGNPPPESKTGLVDE